MYDFIVFLMKAGVVVIIILSVTIGVIWPLLHNYRNRSVSREIESPVRHRGYSRPLYQPDEDELEIPTAAENQTASNRDIVKMALDDPSKTAMLIRNWIQEKK